MTRPRSLFASLLRSPRTFVRNAVFKTLIGPRRYARDDDYDARRYWGDRFSKYGISLRGPGHEGFSEDENATMYAGAGQAVLDLCAREGISLTGSRVLEVGCGTGYYTHLLRAAGVASYTGVDITDVLFPQLQLSFPDFEFIRADVTTDPIPGRYDVVIMIDVIEHIVTLEKLAIAMATLRSCLEEGGVVLMAPVGSRSGRHLFYVHFWSLEDIIQRFPGCSVSEPAPFREDHIVAIRCGSTIST